MRSLHLFPLLYLLGSGFGQTGALSYHNETCPSRETCGKGPNSTSVFLHCVGLPATDAGRDHLQRLKDMLEAIMDVYTFMRSSMTGVPLLSLQGELLLKPDVDPLQNEALVQMWLEVKIRPLLKSITKQFLTCLSTKNFSCSTYRMVVTELSQYYSEMDPVRQKWIYTFFMYPFLSGDRVAGCVRPEEGSEEWLMKNFGAFRAMAQIKDFSALNMVFSGLEVLHLLTPAQKAELLMRPEVTGLDNGTLTLVFNSLLTGGAGPPTTISPGGGNGTSPGYTTTYPLTYHPGPPQPTMKEIVDGFRMAFRPIGSFVHEFVSFTRERDVSEIRSTTLAQFLLNWTLAELADVYRPNNATVAPAVPDFDVTDAEDWYRQVVLPLLGRFLPNSDDMMHPNVKLAFQRVFYLQYGPDSNETSEIQDVCSITLDRSPCGLTNVVKNVAKILHCAGRTELTLSEEQILSLILELTRRLNSLIRELSTTNFDELASDVQQIFSEPDASSLTREHLSDPHFIELWFKVKLMPLLPDVAPALLSCLSTKNFSCPVYQTIVAELSKYMRFMDADPKYGKNIYVHFIYSFLLHHNTSEPQCVASAANSTMWLIQNFDFFSRFAVVTDFYRLNPHFSGLEVLPFLYPKQMAELLLLPLPAPPEKDVVIDRVFDFLMASPHLFPDVLHHLVHLAKMVDPPCGVFRHIFQRLYDVVPSLRPHMEPFIWAAIDELMSIAPQECVPVNITCPLETRYNASIICGGVDSSDLQTYLNTWHPVAAPCNFTLEEYACAQLHNFTANQLASLLTCHLPGNSSQSKMLWKMLLTKVSFVLDPALDILANVSVTTLGPSAMEVLDVIGEIRVSMLTDEQLRNSSEIRKWFSERLSGFLPSVSGRFLRCLSLRNISCHSYQQILQVFINHFEVMTLKQKHVTLMDFILPFLSQPQSGPGCVHGFNSSGVWLAKNLGPFSVFLSVGEIVRLNPHFNPMEVIGQLTPQQSAELLALTLPVLPDKAAIIEQLFDHLTQPGEQRKLPEFMFYLLMFIPQANLSCAAFKTLFTRLDLAMPQVSLPIASNISNSMIILSRHIPPGCIIYSGDCNVTMTNETEICVGVNSTALQLHLHSGGASGSLCDYALEEFACASLSALTAQDLAMMLMCNRSSNSSGSRTLWKLILSKASPVLNEALDLLHNKTLDPANPALSAVLDAIREIRLDISNLADLNDPAFIRLWFHQRLRPFLPLVSADFLSCFATKGLNCSTYQHIVQVLSRVQPHMTFARQMFVYTHFIKVFLTRNFTADPSCSSNTNSSGVWLQKNLGAFSALVSFHDLLMLNSNFSAMEALPQLTIRQLAEVSATPGQLTSPAQVHMLMKHVPSRQLLAFFDQYSPAIMGHENMFPSLVRSAMLQVVFDRANLSSHSVDDSVVMGWLHNRMRPLLVDLAPHHVAPFFGILTGRNCSTEQLGVEDLNSTISSLSEETKKEIHNHIVQLLRGTTPLRCYGDNYNHSFYGFLERSFMGFQFPNLTTFLLLMPHDRMPQLVNSMPPAAMGDFLRRPDIVDDDAQLCVLYDNYRQTPQFLESESLPEVVRRPTLPCVWPMALRSSKGSEVNTWFDRSLPNYFVFLTKSLIGPRVTYNASCLAFQKFVSVLGEFNYTSADFMRPDVFDSIRVYLTSATVPRCYNSSDPDLNSTAWFAEYIGPFMPFLTVEALQMFGSAEVIKTFTVNPENLALLNHSVLPVNLTTYYTQLVYLQDTNFNPMLLPLLCRCFAPGPAFTQLTANESIIVLYNLTTLCTNLDPQVSAALASNLGDNVGSTAIAALGSECAGLSTGQINTIKPEDLIATLSILGSVTDWNSGQANAIIRILLSSGIMQINGSSALIKLGSLVAGVPASVFGGISGSQLIAASEHPSFLANLMSSPQVIQQVFVTQIVSVNSSGEAIITNVPDELATEIPRALLLGFSNDRAVVKKLNKKKWKQQQAELFFSVIAAENATAQLGGVNNISSSVLQGFTCTGVSSIQTVQVKKLVKGCRRRGKNKVQLVQTQLTCMYNYIKGDPDATSFDLFPPDLLLYYDYSLVPQASCRSYFEQLADADFSVVSGALRYKLAELFANARSCLGITNTSLTKDNIMVLGNMCCVLDAAYIENADPSVLGNLMTCADLSDAQAAAAQALLLSGKTQYGDPSTWNEQTLEELGMLPLYMTSTFYENFDKKTKKNFLKYFLEVIKANGVSRERRRTLRREIRNSMKKKSKRATVDECTVGTITSVTIRDETFPFDYDDIGQFNRCLSAATVKDNLDAITGKVDDQENLKIVLVKLHEAYPTSSDLPENQVQLLGAASRVATVDQIHKWSITLIDTLSALMRSSDGQWDPALAKAVISKYLSAAGNKLGSTELNAIGGANLCSLDVDVLKNISQQSLKEANALDVSNCTLEKKKELFTIARAAFSGTTRSTVSLSSYQLTTSYLGGATSDYVKSLASSNVNMDMATFTSLDESVVLNLTVAEVKGLLGTNLPDLKSYENQTLVRSWISEQYQSDLDTLGVGVTGGKADPTTNPTATPAPTPGTTPAPSTNPTTGTTASTGSSSTTTGHGSRIRADAGLSLLLLLLLPPLLSVASQHGVL